MIAQNRNLDYCCMILMLRRLVALGKCTKKEAKNIAGRLAVQNGVEVVFSL